MWPASGLLTGSGVALILRLSGMTFGDFWSWEGWYWFALVAALSIGTKFLIRIDGQHVFNPSNVGLVVAFLVLGSDIVEPLDFWWAPLGFWMVVAYALIIGGGVLITRKLHLFEMAVAFWIVFALGLGVLALSGHCMTASWSPTPVCDGRFWTVLVTSPEVLIFLFFMITDPKTVPAGRGARVVFAGSLALLATFLIAPQTVEFGAKVALLGSLVLWTPLRRLFESWIPDTGDPRALRPIRTLMWDGTSPRGSFTRGVITGSILAIVVSGVIVAGIPAREPGVAAESNVEGRIIAISPSDLPEVAVAPFKGVNVEVDEAFASSLAVMLAENLATEAEAIRIADGSLLGAVDAGERLDEMQARMDEAIATGVRLAHEYRFESLSLRPFESAGQSGAALAFDGAGILTEVVYSPGGSEVSREEGRFESVFVLSQVGSERWLLVEVQG